MTLANDIDANFYNLIHQLRRETQEAGPDERHCQRFPFTLVQRIAPLLVPGVPPNEAFFPVRCVDLNRRGFAFVLAEPPGFTRLVVALGQPPHELLVTAQVAHSHPVIVNESGRVHRAADGLEDGPSAGEPAFLVGCQFLQRLSGRPPRRLAPLGECSVE